MPTLIPDDHIKRTRMVYLGPEGKTLPWTLTYAEYGVLAVATAVCVGFAWFVRGDWGWSLQALCVAVVATKLIVRASNPDRSARKVLRVAATDWRRGPSPAPEQFPAVTARITTTDSRRTIEGRTTR